SSTAGASPPCVAKLSDTRTSAGSSLMSRSSKVPAAILRCARGGVHVESVTPRHQMTTTATPRGTAMKPVPAILAFALPTLAVAGQPQIQLDEKQLRDAVSASALLNVEVRSADDRALGELGEIRLSQDSRVKEYLLEAGDLEESNGDALPDAAQVAEDVRAEHGDNDADLQLDYVVVPPAQVSYDRGEEVLRIDLQKTPLARLPQRDEQISLLHDGINVNDVIGMSVRLEDADDFAEVDDVLF